jgi:hypothetical protein
MPVETHVTLCGNCGAMLGPRGDATEITCTYCQQTTFLTPTTAPPPAAPRRAARPVTTTATADDEDDEDERIDRFDFGPSARPEGRGARYSTAQMASRDALSFERGMWPVGARASSTFGGSWSPSALLGVPRVYPRSGDIGGAWAPGPTQSPAEWIEVDFAHDVPTSAVRVFETNRAGSTYAIVDLTRGEKILWAAEPLAADGAQVLEVAVSPPRVIRKLRVYVVNPGWTEIDTVGLVAAAPLPEALRTRAPPPSRALRVVMAVIVSVIGLAAAVVAVAAIRAPPSTPVVRPPLPARPANALTGATMRFTNPPVGALNGRGVTWASAVTSFSSEYSPTRNGARGVIGAPDVYPRHGDLDGAWASRETDYGPEWIEVRFATPTSARSVVWVESFNPGAVVRVDDVSDVTAPTVLWEGASGEVPSMSVVAEVALPTPRVISAVRLMLDTRRVTGWNEVDAIGLAP